MTDADLLRMHIEQHLADIANETIEQYLPIVANELDGNQSRQIEAIAAKPRAMGAMFIRAGQSLLRLSGALKVCHSAVERTECGGQVMQIAAALSSDRAIFELAASKLVDKTRRPLR